MSGHEYSAFYRDASFLSEFFGHDIKLAPTKKASTYIHDKNGRQLQVTAVIGKLINCE